MTAFQGRLDFPVVKIDAQCLFEELFRLFKRPFAEKLVRSVDRITSYNVCYTKLLRKARNDPENNVKKEAITALGHEGFGDAEHNSRVLHADVVAGETARESHAGRVVQREVRTDDSYNFV